MKGLLAAFVVWLACLGVGWADLQDVLQDNRAAIEKASRKTVDAVLADIAERGGSEGAAFLEQWQDKAVWQRKADGLFFYVETDDKQTYQLIDVSSGAVVGEAGKRDLKNLKPNSGVRGVIGSALVEFQLSDPEPRRRMAALRAIERRPDRSQLEPLRNSMVDEPDAEIKRRKEVLLALLTVRFGADIAERVAAAEGMRDKLSLETRAALNPLLATRRVVSIDGPPDDANVARKLRVGSEDLSEDAAYQMLVSAELALPDIGAEARKAALIASIAEGAVGGVPVAELDSDVARERAFAVLTAEGLAPPSVTAEEREAALRAHEFYEVYTEPSAEVTDAVQGTLGIINQRVAFYQVLDLSLDGLSLASIYFLAAIGLAITFGVMGVINMAHGEFIMMGAYTGYVVQLFVPDYTLSILLALPLAFAVTFGAGVAMERLVIRWLYNRPLETLLATFGISIALQQLAKNIFGTQARPLTSPAWLDGAWVMNDVVSVSYIRIAIFGLGLIFLFLLLFILKRTRLGLEVRAVTQNPRMAASMGINPDKINMLTFGLGSGIAGIAGVAIGLYAKVTSELGSDYIVQSFMTVVVGGVGNIWGTLLGATLIGFLQKWIEWFNPSNTLAAQTFMIVFIIIFIQFRPKGIIALKGRAAGD
ncbi:urea ABC transporter permease subunit UrtB [Actibacterium sp. 188UL27-1]|nr:urea ABC transporter permease subunit UrtB [Actibacterium sp. 188UL27-1]MBM7068543.1 urea ABC transporter permease subunit UrtB [Actibacterium sp. 188UL27-1]